MLHRDICLEIIHTYTVIARFNGGSRFTTRYFNFLIWADGDHWNIMPSIRHVLINYWQVLLKINHACMVRQGGILNNTSMVQAWRYSQ
jgi:hypothetical protein